MASHDLKSGFDVRGIRSRNDHKLLELKAATKPITIVSADSHVAAPPEDFVGYLDPKYRHWGDTYLKTLEPFHEAFRLYGYPLSSDLLDIIDTRNAMRS